MVLYVISVIDDETGKIIDIYTTKDKYDCEMHLLEKKEQYSWQYTIEQKELKI